MLFLDFKKRKSFKRTKNRFIKVLAEEDAISVGSVWVWSTYAVGVTYILAMTYFLCGGYRYSVTASATDITVVIATPYIYIFMYNYIGSSL